MQINDAAINTADAWSSQQIVDTLCPAFEETGNPVVCYPVAGYPLGVKASWEPRQAGTGDPAPSNIRAISGRESVEVVACGKNIADIVDPYQIISKPTESIVESIVTSGSIEMHCSDALDAQWVAWRIFWPVKSQTNYTISAKMESDDDSYTPNLGIYVKKGKSGVSANRGALTANGSTTINTNENDMIGVYLYFTTTTGSTGMRTVRYFDIQIEESTTPTAYAPYTGTTATLTLPETIYGGTVDAVTGTGSKTWGYIASYNGESLPGEWMSDRDVYSAGATPATGAQVAYKLATPTQFQATGNAPIPALSGVNTVYSDADSVTVTGRADPIHTIQALSDRVEALENAAATNDTGGIQS